MEQIPKQENKESENREDKTQSKKEGALDRVITEYEIIEYAVLENGERIKNRNLKGFTSLMSAQKYIEEEEKDKSYESEIKKELQKFPENTSIKLEIEPKEYIQKNYYSTLEEKIFLEKIKELGYEPVGYGIPIPGYQENNYPHYSNPDGSLIYEGQSVYVNDEGQYADDWYFWNLLGYNLVKKENDQSAEDSPKQEDKLD